MNRIVPIVAAILMAFFSLSDEGFAQSGPEFKLGFKVLADQIPAVVGQPTENEHWGDNGDSLQMTTIGLMAWRKADNWTAFTNGSRTWVNGPFGVMERANDDRFEWEAPPPAPAAAAPVAQIGQRTKTAGCVANGPLPDGQCTPGAVFEVTADQVCVAGYSTSVRDVPESVKNAVYAEYAIASHEPGQYEVDHLISLELGGSNDIANLWPEPADPQPGFHQKDQLENYLHAQACSGAISLEDAQREIAGNWLDAYGRMRGSEIPSTAAPATVAPVPTATTSPVSPASGVQSETPAGAWVTSSYRTAKYYYSADDSRWQVLSPQYRVWFATNEDLLKAFPDRVPAP